MHPLQTLILRHTGCLGDNGVPWAMADSAFDSWSMHWDSCPTNKGTLINTDIEVFIFLSTQTQDKKAAIKSGRLTKKHREGFQIVPSSPVSTVLVDYETRP